MLNVLMHLQMQRDVWLDNVINLRQYIRRYTSPNENFEYIYPLNIFRFIYSAIKDFHYLLYPLAGILFGSQGLL